MKNWTFTKRFLVLWQIPPIVVALTIGGYLTHSYLEEVEELILERGITDSKQWSDLISQSVPSRNEESNEETYQQIANTLLEEKGIRAVRISSSDKTLMIAAGPDMLQTPMEIKSGGDNSYQVLRGDQSVRFKHPIHNRPGATWIEIEYSLKPYRAGAYQTVLGSVVLVTVLLMFLALLAIKGSNSIRRAFQTIGTSLEKLKKGDLDCEIHIDSTTELNQLADQINQALAGLQTHHIDSQRDAEQTTRDLRETLETIEIQNIELDLARKEALEAEQITSRFLANTSHEIRTPLNSIIGFTNLLLKSPNANRQEEYLTTIKYSAEGLLAIINDILDFSKVEAGKLVLDHSTLHLRTMVEKSLATLTPNAEEKNLDLVLIIDPDVPLAVMGDPLRIQQILTNLISNAIKFTNQGHVLVSLKLEEKQDQSALLKFVVADTGIGLDPQQQSNLFRAFSQAEHFSTDASKGTGLGLVIAKHIVQQMGGDIGVRSRPGEGSEFWFSINCPIADYEQPESLRGKKICLVAPEEPIGTAIRSLLESWFIKVHRSNTIAETAHKAHDAVIVNLKGINRQEDVISELKALDGQPSIALMPFTTDENLEKTLREANIHPLQTFADHLKVFNSLIQLLGIDKPQNAKIETNISQSPALLGKNPKILAVDDNPANLKLLTILLEDSGAEVTQAENGQEAVIHAKNQTFDLIFMDVRMPVMNGIEATEAIRCQRTINQNTPIIALTAHALTEERRTLLQAGMNDHLTKPVSEEQIKASVLHWCLNATEAANDENPKVDPEQPETLTHSMPVDVSLCLKLVNNRGELAKEMLAGVLLELENNQGDINSAYEAENYDVLLDKVHRLHGVCCYSGVPNLRQVTQSIEEVLKKNQMDLLDEKMSELNLQISLLQDWHTEHDIDLLFEDA